MSCKLRTQTITGNKIPQTGVLLCLTVRNWVWSRAPMGSSQSSHRIECINLGNRPSLYVSNYLIQLDIYLLTIKNNKIYQSTRKITFWCSLLYVTEPSCVSILFNCRFQKSPLHIEVNAYAKCKWRRRRCYRHESNTCYEKRHSSVWYTYFKRKSVIGIIPHTLIIQLSTER